MALRSSRLSTEPPLREVAITPARVRRQSFDHRKRPIHPQLLQKLVALLIAGTLAGLVSLAYASPADPTWIAGIYDDADYDDMISCLTDKTDASSGQVATLAEQGPIAWMSRPKSGRIPKAIRGAERSRSPPVESCDGSIDFRLNAPVRTTAHFRSEPSEHVPR